MKARVEEAKLILQHFQPDQKLVFEYSVPKIEGNKKKRIWYRRLQEITWT